MEKGQTRKLSYDELESDEKLLLKWYRENPLSVYIEIALIALEELEVITKMNTENIKQKQKKSKFIENLLVAARGKELSCIKTI